MKIGILSDTHIPEQVDALPGEVISGLKGADVILHAGDLVDLKVFDILKKIAGEVFAVYGNMDYPAVRQKLPQKIILEYEGLRIGLFHGKGAAENIIPLLKEVFKEDNLQIVVFGHSHQALVTREDGILYFNPGSPTDKIYAPFNSYGILEIEKGIIKKTDIIKIK